MDLDGALRLGSIRFNVVVRSELAKNAFVELMKLVFAEAARDLYGQEPSWKGPQPAPEGERSGHG